MDAKTGVYETKNQTKKTTFKYEQEQIFCLGLAKVESKNGTITGKHCLVFDYIDKNIFTIDALQKRNPKWIRKNEEAYFVFVTMGRKN